MIAHRTGRAALRHPAPTVGQEAKTHKRIGMTDRLLRKRPCNKTLYTSQAQVAALAATAQHRVP